MSDITETVRKLLDKAQSSEFVEEANTFFAKAQALIEKHGITDAALRAAGTVQKGEVVEKTIHFEAPYAYGKLLVAWSMRHVFGFEAVRTGRGKNQALTVVGIKENIENFEIVLAAALVHATGEMLKADANRPSYENARSFRAAFLEGYSSRIGQVLAKAKREARQEAEETLTTEESKGVALVLLDDKERVHQAFKARFPSVSRSGGHSSRSYGGRSAGAAAASSFSGAGTGLGGARAALGA